MITIPVELLSTPQWVAWRLEAVEGKDKPKKPPYNPTSSTRQPRLASPTNPTTWGTYGQAVAFAKAVKMDGVGLVLTRNLGLALVDLDNCVDDAGNVAPWAMDIVRRLDSYTEYSPSGRGLHVLAWGAVAALKTKRVEIYSDQRFTTITGRIYGDVRPIRHAQHDLDLLREEHAPPPPPPVETKPPSLASIDTSDGAIIDKILSIPKYAELWRGNATGNLSSADFALINGLIWLCGPDAAQVERLFRQSGLYRPKHDRNSGGGHSNLAVSIHNAIGTFRGQLYKWPLPAPVARSAPEPIPKPEPEPPELSFTARINAFRLQLRYGGLAGLTKGRTHDTDLAVCDALLDLAIERGRLDNLAIGLERLRALAGLGSTSTARAVLGRLAWFATKERTGDKITRADTYSLNPQCILTATELKVILSEPVTDEAAASSAQIIYCLKSHPEFPAPNIMRFATINNVYSEHRGDDTFSTGGGGGWSHPQK